MLTIQVLSRGRALRRIPLSRRIFNHHQHAQWLCAFNVRPRECREISTNTYDSLRLKGLVKSCFPDNIDLNEALSKRQTIYAGFDPTASSLHVGNLLVLVTLLQLYREGHRIIVLIGDATAQIGDPSGKTTERQVLPKELIEANTLAIKNDIETVFENFKHLTNIQRPDGDFIICRNNDWYKSMNAVEFITNYGRQLRMGTLLNKSSVRERLESQQGLSLSEFSYQLFQAYDWLHLFRKHRCRFQVGGVDQIVNIHNGHDMIKKLAGDNQTFGLFMPLITDEKGNKIGKSEAGRAIFLNPDLTSYFSFFQYFMRIRDLDIQRFLKMFSFKSDREIEVLIQQQLRKPKPWALQEALAKEMTLFVHGQTGLANAQRITEAFFSKDLDMLGALKQEEMLDVFYGAEEFNLELVPDQTSVLDIAMRTNCFDSIKNAVNTIQEGGFHLNYSKIRDPNLLIDERFILRNNITIVGVGKRNYRLVKWL